MKKISESFDYSIPLNCEEKKGINIKFLLKAWENFIHSPVRCRNGQKRIRIVGRMHASAVNQQRLRG